MKITVLGAGAYGTALATILDENKHEVTIWSAFQDEIDYGTLTVLKQQNLLTKVNSYFNKINK